MRTRSMGFRILYHLRPAPQIGVLGLEVQPHADFAVEPLLVQLERDLVDGSHVRTLHHAPEVDVAELRDLALQLFRKRSLGATDQDIGLDPDLHQLSDGMLSGFGLELGGGGDEGNEGEVDEQRIVAAHFLAELPNRLEERQRLDVAHRAAHLDDRHVGVAGAALDERLDLVGDVRDHLDRAAQVVAAPLLLDHRLVDLAGGEIVPAAHLRALEALVVAQVQVGFRPVVGDEHLAVLKRAHGARIDVDVRVQLDVGDADAARLEDRGEGCGGDAFP